MQEQGQPLFIQEFDQKQYICFIITILFSCLGWLNKYIPLNFGKNEGSFLQILLPNTISWIVFESPNLILSFYFLFNGDYQNNVYNIICISPFIIHYINRVLIYPIRNPSNKKIPLEIVLSAGLFTSSNAYLQTTLFLNSPQNQYSSTLFSQPSFYLGWMIYILGMYINISSDNYMAELKNEVLERQKKGEKKEYKIPTRGLYKYVTQANYLGEIIELFGYGLLSWSFQGFWFCFTTLMILSSRARDNHNWYLRNFKDYPKDRKIIIPYLY